MGPIKTNFPGGTMPPSRPGKGKRAREEQARERMAAYIAKQDPDAIRARFARASAERDGSCTLVEQGKADKSVTPPICTPVPITIKHEVLSSKRQAKEARIDVPARIAAFWSK